MKLNLKSIILIISGLAIALLLVVLIYDLLPFSIYSSQAKTESGTIVKSNEDWGLEVEKGLLFKHREIYLISDASKGFTENFQKSGLKVECSYQITDVIGTSGDWSTVITIHKMKQR